MKLKDIALKYIADKVIKSTQSSGGYNPRIASYGSVNASWLDLTTNERVLQAESNPALRAVLDVLADAEADAIFKIIDLKTGEYVSDEDAEKNPNYKKALDLYRKPNSIESGKNFIRQNSKMFNVWGYAFVMSLSNGFGKFNYKNVETLNVLFSEGVKITLNNNSRLSATEKGELIKNIEYSETIRSRTTTLKDVDLKDLLILSNASILQRAYPLGTSKLTALTEPLTNIKLAYETINKILQSRGIEIVISPETGAGSELQAKLQKTDRESLQKNLSVYGRLKDQINTFISDTPVKVTKISQKMADLMLYPIIMNDLIVIGNAYGIPPSMLRISESGATFNNQETDEKRFYQDTVITNMNERYQSYSNWLGFREDGFDVVPTFDHLPFLQADKKLEAEVNSKKIDSMLKLFMKNLITQNQVLNAVGMPEISNGNRFMYQLGEKELVGLVNVSNNLNTENNE